MAYFASIPTIVDSNRLLYTASSFARTSLLHLQEIGELTALKPHVSSRSDLVSYLFFIVIDGEGILEYNGKAYSLEKGSCVFIDCRKPYSHSTSSNLWTLKWCHFYGPTLNTIYDKYLERGGQLAFTSQTSTFEKMKDVWTSLMDIAYSSDYMRDMLINQELSKLITLLMSESWHPEIQTTASKKASVLDVKDWLDIHYSEQITLDGLADKFFISKCT